MFETGQDRKIAALRTSVCVHFFMIRNRCFMNKYMKVAIKEAKKSLKTGDVPVGAVIVKNNELIAKAHNQREKYQDSTKHAEIICISQACKKLKTWRLDDCTLYVTLEPCMMCLGAISQARISHVIFAASNEKYGCVHNTQNIVDKFLLNKIKIESGLYKEESIELLQEFFKNKRI